MVLGVQGSLIASEIRRAGITPLIQLPVVIPHQDCNLGMPRSEIEVEHRINNESSDRAQRAHAPLSESTGESIILYADDILEFTCNSTALEALLAVFDSVFTRYSMTIAQDKTETMVFNDADTNETVIKLGDYQFKNVVKFRYLGYTWHSDQSASCCIRS